MQRPLSVVEQFGRVQGGATNPVHQRTPLAPPPPASNALATLAVPALACRRHHHATHTRSVSRTETAVRNRHAHPPSLHQCAIVGIPMALPTPPRGLRMETERRMLRGHRVCEVRSRSRRQPSRASTSRAGHRRALLALPFASPLAGSACPPFSGPLPAPPDPVPVGDVP